METRAETPREPITIRVGQSLLVDPIDAFVAPRFRGASNRIRVEVVDTGREGEEIYFKIQRGVLTRGVAEKELREKHVAHYEAGRNRRR